MNLEQIQCKDGNGNRTSRCVFTISGTVSLFLIELPNYPIIYSCLTRLIFDCCV